MATREERLRERKEQIEKQLKQIENRKKNAERKIDTRRKLLVGAFIMSQRQAEYEKLVASTEFQEYLTRNIDRAAFGFAPLPNKQEDGKEQQQQKAQVQPQTDTNEKSEEATKIQAGPPKGTFVIKRFDDDI